jgi:hypothetical protein
MDVCWLRAFEYVGDYDKKQRKKAEKAAQQLIDDRPVPEPLVATGVVEDAEPSEDPIGDFTGDEVPMGEDEESLYPGQEATRPVPAALPTLSDPWADFDELMGIGNTSMGYNFHIKYILTLPL